MATTNTNLLANCCDEYTQAFRDTYGDVPTGINPGNISLGGEPNSCLWSNIFGSDGWWENSTNLVINPYNRNQQSSRNCINFRKKCQPKNSISLAEKDGCCDDACASVIYNLDILKRVPKVASKTVTVLGPTKMCKNSVSPPIPLKNLWSITITPQDSTVLYQADLFRYQVSRNGHSWTTLPADMLDYDINNNNLYDFLFNTDASQCETNCLSCSGAPSAPNPNTAVEQEFPDTNAFYASTGFDGSVRVSCPPKYCFLRIVSCGGFCLKSFTATYANGGGFCSSLPTCPAGFVYEDKVCRPLPARSCPGLPSPQVGSFCDPNYPDKPVPISTNAEANRQLLSITKQVKKQFPGGQDASQYMRNVRAVAGAPFNSRATNDGARGIKKNVEGYACGMCQETINPRCGEGCAADGTFLPRDANVNCGWPAACRRPYATKHQTTDVMLDKLVACAVAGCKFAATGVNQCSVPFELTSFNGTWTLDGGGATDYTFGTIGQIGETAIGPLPTGVTAVRNNQAIPISSATDGNNYILAYTNNCQLILWDFTDPAGGVAVKPTSGIQSTTQLQFTAFGLGPETGLVIDLIKN